MQPLTAREQQVIGFLARGMRVSEIAAKLGTNEKSVHEFRKRALEKLDCNTIGDALRKYVGLG